VPPQSETRECSPESSRCTEEQETCKPEKQQETVIKNLCEVIGIGGTLFNVVSLLLRVFVTSGSIHGVLNDSG